MGSSPSAPKGFARGGGCSSTTVISWCTCSRKACASSTTSTSCGGRRPKCRFPRNNRGGHGADGGSPSLPALRRHPRRVLLHFPAERPACAVLLLRHPSDGHLGQRACDP